MLPAQRRGWIGRTWSNTPSSQKSRFHILNNTQGLLFVRSANQVPVAKILLLHLTLVNRQQYKRFLASSRLFFSAERILDGDIELRKVLVIPCCDHESMSSRRRSDHGILKKMLLHSFHQASPLPKTDRIHG
jgi:hypothetical protein